MNDIMVATTIMITIILSLAIILVLFIRNLFNRKKKKKYLNDKYILLRGILFFSIHQFLLFILEVSIYYTDSDNDILFAFLYIISFFFLIMVSNRFFDNKKWLIWLILSGLAITANISHREYNQKYTFPIYKENTITINYNQQIDVPFFEKFNLMPMYLEEFVGDKDYFNYIENYQGENCTNYVFFPSIKGKHNDEINNFYNTFKKDKCINFFYINYFDINGDGIMFRSQFIGGFKNIKHSTNRFFLDNISFEDSIVKNVRNVENINIVYRDNSKQIAFSYLANMKDEKKYFDSKNYLITQKEEALKITSDFKIKSSNDFQVIEVK